VLLTGADLAVGGRQGSARWKSLDKKRERLGSEREKQIRDVFRQIDRDNSGALSVQELQAALKEMGIYKAKEEVAMTITEIDANNSGQVDANEVGFDGHRLM
jgi:Ca2+-binding EF-hand superfamily protein